jgi:hypothetical protein
MGPVTDYYVYVNPVPAITPMTYTVCSGTSFTVTPVNGTNGIVPSGTTYSWPAPTGNGFTGGAAGSGSSITGTLTNTTSAVKTATYTVTPTAGTCAGSTFILTVTLNPTPHITPSPMRDTVCSGITFTVTPVDGTNGIVPAGTTYSWDAPSGAGYTGSAAGTDQVNISGTLIDTTTSTIIVIYGVTPNAGSCIGSLFLVRVTLEPAPQITNMSTPVCSGTPFTVTPANGTNGIVPPGTTYSWPAPAGTGFTGGAVGNNQNNIFGTLINTTSAVQTATYTVTPTTGTCTGSTFTITVTLNPKPAINNMTDTVCSGTTFTVTPVNGTNGIVPSGTTYSWPAPTGTGFTGGAAGSGSSITGTLTNITSAVQTVTYTVTPTAGICAGNTFTITVTLNPRPAINNMTATVCSGTTFTVTPVDVTNGIVPSGTTYSWPAPTGSDFTGGAAGSGSSITGTLTNTTSAVQIATYTVTPTAGTCTGNTFTVTVTLDPIPAINNITAIVCSGTTFTVAPVDVTNGIVPLGTTYSWPAPTGTGFTGGTAGSGSSITGTLTNTTSVVQTATYTVTPTAGTCAGSTFTVTVTLNPTPVVTNSPLLQTICSGASTTLVTLTSNVAGTTFAWTATATTGVSGFTATGTGTIPVQTITTSQSTQGIVTYVITPTAAGCTGPVTYYYVYVNPLPVPIINGPNPVCVNSTGNVYVTQPGKTNYIWSVSAGGTITAGGSSTDNTVTVTWNTVGNQTVSVIYTDTNGCTGNTTYSVTINPLPITSPIYHR